MSETFLGFWETLPKPIIALAPMDGVTDFACRYIMARLGRPDVIFTEFVTVEGLFHAPEKILRDFEYNEIERPIVAQIYGQQPDDFYKATHIVCELGFDGVDINMGCPSKAVVKRNCGGKLITTPHVAIEILRATRQAIHDWANGATLKDLGLPESMMDTLCQMNTRRVGTQKLPIRRLIPYSVKTRIGYDSVVIEKWVETLLQERPATLSIHGRTLKQMYSGRADWGAIGRAALLIKKTKTLVLGNGDITSLEEALLAIQASGVDGVLIGRSAIGNPWIFQNQTRVERSERVAAAMEHAAYFQKVRGEMNFKHLNKHLVGYLRHFPDAAQLRTLALQVKSIQELTQLFARAG